MPTEKNLTTIEKVFFLKSVDIFEHATVEQLGRIAGLTQEVHFEPEKPSIKRERLETPSICYYAVECLLREMVASFVRLRKKKP